MSLKHDVLKQLDFKNYYSGNVKKFKSNGTSLALGLCPFHDDHNPSLSVNLSNGFHKCYACGESGSVFDFFMKQNNVEFSTALKTLAREAGISSNSNGKPPDKIVERYDYKDKEGKLIFQVVRKEPKNFVQRRPDGKDGWIWDLKGVEPVLYNLQKILDAHEVLIPEGEKDCNRLASLGLIATTCPGGAGKWKAEYDKYFKDKDVVLLPDNDDIGRKHSLEIANSLYKTAKSIKVLELPNLPDKGDVSNFLDTLDNKEDAIESLAVKIDNCGEWQPEESPIIKDPWTPVDVSQWLKEEPPKRVDLFKNLIPRGIVGAILACGGTGKTYLLLYLILSAITGKKFFNCFEPEKPLKVLAFLGEDPETEIWRRFRSIINNSEIEISDYMLKENLMLICGITEPLMKLEDSNSIVSDRYKWLSGQVKEFQPDIIFIDPKSQFYGLEENNNTHNTDWVNALKNLANINGSTVIFSHHVNKGSKGELSQLSSRGGSALTDACRWIANLKRLEESDGAKYEIDDPWKYIEFQVTKNSYTPALPSSLFFRFEEGGFLTQVDIKADQLTEISGILRDALKESSDSLSKIEISTKNTGKLIRDQIKENSNLKITGKIINDAIEFGLNNHILKEEKILNEKNRKYKTVIRPI